MKTVHKFRAVVDCNDFDDVVKQELGKEYQSFRACYDAYQNSYHEVDVAQDLYDYDFCGGDYEFPTVEQWLTGEFDTHEEAMFRQPNVGAIVDALRKRGYAIPDRFILLVRW